MIGRLRGILIHKAPPWIVIEVHGVGYELEAPMSTFYDLPEIGREVFLFTHYAQKEDSVSLYGFLRESERRLFRDVTRILGIDPGSQRTGVGIIDVATDGKVVHVHHQPLVLLDAESFPLRLRKLLDGLWALIE